MGSSENSNLARLFSFQWAIVFHCALWLGRAPSIYQIGCDPGTTSMSTSSYMIEKPTPPRKNGWRNLFVLVTGVLFLYLFFRWIEGWFQLQGFFGGDSSGLFDYYLLLGESFLFLLLSVIILTQINKAKKQAMEYEKKLEIELGFSNSLIEGNPDYVLVLSLSGEVLLANSSLKSLCNGRKNDSFLSCCAPEMAQKLKTLVEDPNSACQQIISCQLVPEAGDHHDVEWHVKPLAEATDQISAILLVGRDLTKQHEAEHQLEMLSNQFSTFFDQFPGAVYIKDLEGNFHYGNEKSSIFVQEGTLQGKKDTDVFPPEEIEKLRSDEGAIREGKAINTLEELTINNKDVHTFHLIKFPLPTDQRILVGGIAIDVSDMVEIRRRLEESQQQLNLLYDSMEEGVVILDCESHHVLYANSMFCSLFGYRLEDVLGIDSLNFTFEHQKNDYHGFISHLGEKEKYRQVLARHQSGRELFLNLSCIRFDYMKKKAFIFIVQDVTEEYRQNQMLKYRSDLQHVLTQILGLFVGGKGEKLRNSVDQTLKIFGEFIGANNCFLIHVSDEKISDFDNVYEWTDCCSESEDEKTKVASPRFLTAKMEDQDFCRQVISIPDTENPPEGLSSHFLDFLGESGMKSFLSIPIFSSGKLNGLIGFESLSHQALISKDIKNALVLVGGIILHRLEIESYASALELSEARFRTFMDYSPILASIRDLDGRYIYANRACLDYYHCTLSEIVGKTDRDFSPYSSPFETAQGILNNPFQDHSVDRQIQMPGVNGENQWWSITQFSIKDKYDNRVIGELRFDISSIKKAENQLQFQKDLLRSQVEDRTKQLRKSVGRLEEMSRYKSQFLSNMSHELRTPLNAILGFANLLAAEHFGSLNDKQKDYVQRVEEGGFRLLDLIKDLLEMAKIDSGDASLQIASYSLQSLFEVPISRARSQASKHQLQLEVDLKEETQEVLADKHKFRQIMTNLLSNAVKFTPSGGKITIESSFTEQGELLTRISDTGCGVDIDHIDCLFDEFHRVEKKGTLTQGGIGIGLPICKRLVELHGGKIGVESKPGKGSVFWFSLPNREPSIHRVGSLTQRMLEPVLKGKNILLLSVSKSTNVPLIKDFSNIFQAEFLQCCTVDDCIKSVKMEEPDLIIVESFFLQEAHRTLQSQSPLLKLLTKLDVPLLLVVDEKTIGEDPFLNYNLKKVVQVASPLEIENLMHHLATMMV